MISRLVKRQLLLYSRNRSGVFFSMLGGLITFIVYLVFLRHNLQKEWGLMTNGKDLLNLWLIGGILPVVALTTSLSNLGQRVEDGERLVRQDLLMTGLPERHLDLAYLVGAMLVSTLMQVFVLLVMVSYFLATDGFSLSMSTALELIFLILVNSLLHSLLSFIVTHKVGRVANLEKVTMVVGSLSQFLVGNYIPIGKFPELAQTLIKLTPSSYMAALFRTCLMAEPLMETFARQVDLRHQLEEDLGIRLSWGELLSRQQMWWVLLGFLVVCLLLFYLQTRQQEGIIKTEKRTHEVSI